MNGTGPVIAGIELGGTKSVALIARGTHIIDTLRIPTGDAAATLGALSGQLALWSAGHDIAALGIGSFGPLGLDPGAVDFGRITTTPKPGWSNIDVRGHFAQAFAGPIGFDTDVAGAGLAEQRWGAAIGTSVHVYLTIGTGIGGGVIVDGRPVHGLVHPELGHLRIRRVPGDSHPGICPYHGDCLEGLASGPAIAARAGAPATELPTDHPIWRNVAAELAEMVAMLVLTLSPQRIIIGGGVGLGGGGGSSEAALLPAIRARTLLLLAGYVTPLSATTMDTLLCAPGLGDRAGPLGAIALGQIALETEKRPATA